MTNKLKILGTPEVTSEPSVRFALHFGKMPDFNTLDSANRPADSFQIFIAYDPAAANPANPQAVNVLIRGDEIHLSQDIRVRDARPAVADPVAGGWGPLRGAVLYELKAERDGSAWLVFHAPYSLLGISGQFSYVLETYNYGTSLGTVRGVGPS